MGAADDVRAPTALTHETAVEVALLLVSRRHRYEGRPADGPLPADEDERRDRIELRAGLGIVGDRYFASRAHVHASVTVIGLEALHDIADELGVEVDPVATRRNVFLRGVDVEALRGEPFSLDSGAGKWRSAGTGRRTPAPGWTTRSRRAPSGRCADGAGCGATRSPTVCSPSGPRCSARPTPSRRADRPGLAERPGRLSARAG